MFQISLRIVSFVLYKEILCIWSNFIYKIEQIINNKLTQIKLNYIYISIRNVYNDQKIKRNEMESENLYIQTENIIIK